MTNTLETIKCLKPLLIIGFPNQLVFNLIHAFFLTDDNSNKQFLLFSCHVIRLSSTKGPECVDGTPSNNIAISLMENMISSGIYNFSLEKIL